MLCGWKDPFPTRQKDHEKFLDALTSRCRRTGPGGSGRGVSVPGRGCNAQKFIVAATCDLPERYYVLLRMVALSKERKCISVLHDHREN